MKVAPQRGFTLVELAIVLVVAGLLLGAFLKGRELVVGARVKNLVSQQDGFRVAVLAFQDRFGAPPGDHAGASTHLTCRATCLNGNGNGRIESNAVPADGSEIREDLLAWTHLSAAGFLAGDYFMQAGANAPRDDNSPKNPYGVHMQIVFDGNYGSPSNGVARHNIKTGNQIPVSVLAEVDHKFDDGRPYAGGFQFSTYTAPGGMAPTHTGTGSCLNLDGSDAIWNAIGGVTNCGAATLF
jgi:prepilin-type N-terminal cleavage/methylation domain-containing protein